MCIRDREIITRGIEIGVIGIAEYILRIAAAIDPQIHIVDGLGAIVSGGYHIGGGDIPVGLVLDIQLKVVIDGALSLIHIYRLRHYQTTSYHG